MALTASYSIVSHAEADEERQNVVVASKKMRQTRFFSDLAPLEAFLGSQETFLGS